MDEKYAYKDPMINSKEARKTRRATFQIALKILLLIFRLQLISNTSDGLDIISCLLKLGSKRTDMNIYRSGLTGKINAPDALQDNVSCKDPPGTLHQKL